MIQSDGNVQTINMAPRHYMVAEHCVDVLNKVTPNLYASVAPLSQDQRDRLPWLKRIAQYKTTDCENFHRRGTIMKDFDHIYADHDDKIGVILPPVAANEAALQLILGELSAALKRNGTLYPERVIITRRVDKREDASLRAAAELIHLNRVSLLIGINSTQTQALAKIADVAQVPVFMVNPTTPHAKTRQTMRIYPPIAALARKLLDVYRANGITHTTVLYPRGSDLDLLDQLKKIGGKSIYFMESSYDPSSPTDILNSTRGATQRMAMLSSPTQGVLILDNFKMVRHLVNIIRGAAGSMKLVLTGNQQWRSPALVHPREEGLEGALFVDFIGSYADVPSGLAAPIPESPFFTTAQAASRIDYQIIGHRLGTLAAQVLRSPWSRQRIAVELQSLTNSWDNYFPVGAPAFDAQRDSSWPAFMFKVEGESIQLSQNGSSP